MKLLDWILILLVIVSLLFVTQNFNMIVWVLIFGGIFFYRRSKWQQV